jgi:hypothetical protein
MESAFKRVLTNRNPKFEFLLEKKLAFPCQARVSEPRFGQGFPKVPEERYTFYGINLGLSPMQIFFEKL